jgi:hypothetical protein
VRVDRIWRAEWPVGAAKLGLGFALAIRSRRQDTMRSHLNFKLAS